jgi:hypothetical protein
MFECQRVQDNQRDVIATKANWRQEGTCDGIIER